MTTTNDVILTRIESMEAELARLKGLLVTPPGKAPGQGTLQTKRGVATEVSISDEELAEITHPQRRIDALKAENAALKDELARYKDKDEER